MDSVLCCIEGGDDLVPDCGLAFGRMVGVGVDGRLTGCFSLSFSLLAGAGLWQWRRRFAFRNCAYLCIWNFVGHNQALFEVSRECLLPACAVALSYLRDHCISYVPQYVHQGPKKSSANNDAIAIMKLDGYCHNTFQPPYSTKPWPATVASRS
ncbi:hypothetical protein LZ31DRAFT_127289 [Colletotrichum somersetense]|nr:hypothetical protein LZ31DRAFT_127289 [Colletotrichum somersetense]